MHNDRFEQAEDLVIVGPQIRTDPARAAGDIPALWQRFLRDAPHGGPIYAVYTDYESDHRGAYTMVLGREDGAGERRIVIPAGPYARFTVQGDPAQVVWQAWRFINGDWPGRTERRYAADYERHGGAAIEIAVGLG
jgi:predicted transcriptional regulator YdeE